MGWFDLDDGDDYEVEVEVESNDHRSAVIFRAIALSPIRAVLAIAKICAYCGLSIVKILLIKKINDD